MSNINNRVDGAASGNLTNLKRLVYFVAVVETGSFTAAADRLGITKAVVSQQVARLEREFKTDLLTRTTRKVALTDAGRLFYQRCALILKDAGDAFDQLAEVSKEPSGTLRLTAPLDYGISTLVAVIAAFTQRYPQCKVDAVLSDQSMDLMTGQIELAVRIGWLTDLNLPARQVGSFRQVLVAASSWQQKLADIAQPEDMQALPFIANMALKQPGHWHFTRHALDQKSIVVEPLVSLDETLAVREAVRQGIGWSVLPDYMIGEDLQTGRLIEVLPQWELPAGGIHVVYPASRFRSAKVRAFVDLFLELEGQRR